MPPIEREKGKGRREEGEEKRENPGSQFPIPLHEEMDPAMDRRAFLTLLGASLALAGLSGCTLRPPDEKIVPYVHPPDADEMTPGKPLFYATACPRNGYVDGVLVTSREGRPIKIEGNLLHPASLGASDAITQATLLEMYDPDRSQQVMHRGLPGTWDAFLGEANTYMQAQRAVRGAGLRVLTGSVTSPTLVAQIRAMQAQLPAMQWHQHEPISRDNVRAGAQMAFGRYADTLYDFTQSAVIVSLDGDFLLSMPGHVRYARDYAASRRVRTKACGPGQPAREIMSRLYVAESMPTLTGTMADHRLPLRARDIENVARALAQQVGVNGVAPTEPLPPEVAEWVAVAARDLQAFRGAGVIVPGDFQPPAVHALAHAMNAALGNTGKAVRYIAPVEAEPMDQAASFRKLVQDMQAGQVQMLIILSSNPVYTSPADLDFAGAMAKVPMSVHLGLYDDETSALCQWHIPETHYLETWSDGRAYDGTTTIMQPLIAPLYDNTRSAHELLDALLVPPGRAGHDIVKTFWSGQHRGADFEAFWRKSLNDGVAAHPLSLRRRGGTELSSGASVAGQVSLQAANPTSQPGSPSPVPGGGGLELIFRPDPTIWDGRYANNGWLQELPKPLTKLTWDNAVLMSPRTAEKLGLTRQGGTPGTHPESVPVVELRYRGRSVRGPVLILPGHPDGSATVTLGYGRTRAGHVGTGAGFNAYALRTSDALWHDDGLEIVRTDDLFSLGVTHSHQTMEGRDIVRIGSITQFRKDPHNPDGKEHVPNKPPMILPEAPPLPPSEYAWGMSIDNNVCIGCNACVVACQAENNIPVVGKEQVLGGREMHWLRIDRYYTGMDMERPTGTYFMPIPCMQCEKAPCELVCPVDATLHSDDGLNMMVYNRCVGTRYCSNNCPYKVRRFNFLQYADIAPVIQLMRNPEVTVRSRGVMEKCTYCVQRIQNAKIDAEVQDRKVGGDEVQTACQQACPTNAIVFGDINQPDSQVAQLKAEPHDYPLLAELGTRPRTTYLARLVNPNPEMRAE